MNTMEQRLNGRPTIKDVARLAGVSAGTVSNALSGKRKVDDDTRARIDKAIVDLGYVPNLAARGTRTGRAHAIAVFSSMPTAVAAGASKLGFLMEVAASAAVAALARNTALVLIPPIDDPSDVLRTLHLDGAVLVEPERNDPFVQLLRDRRIPVTVIGDYVDDDVPFVRLDYEKMANVLFDRLVQSGASNFPLLIGQSDRSTNTVFEQVYRTKCAATGMTPRVIALAEASAERAAHMALSREIEDGRPVDGVMVPIDAMATGVMQALMQHGLQVPRDVRVVTRYDGIRARSANPPITAIDLRLDEVARLATDALLDRIEGKPVTNQITPPDLVEVVRASTRAS